MTDNFMGAVRFVDRDEEYMVTQDGKVFKAIHYATPVYETMKPERRTIRRPGKQAQAKQAKVKDETPPCPKCNRGFTKSQRRGRGQHIRYYKGAL